MQSALRVVLSLCLLITSSVVLMPQGLASETASRISALIRVGRYEAALEEMNARPPADPTERSLWAVLEAQIRYAQGDLKGAGSAIAACTDPDLDEPTSLLKLRLTLAAGDPHEAMVIARRVTQQKDISDATRYEAAFELARLVIQTKKGTGEGVESLEALLKQDITVDRRTDILRILAQRGNKDHARTLLIRYPDSPGGRELFKETRGAELNSTDRMERIRTLFSMRVHDLLLPELERMISDADAPAVFVQEAKLKRAIIKMRLRNEYPSALKLLVAAETGPSEKIANESRYRQALVQGSLGHFKDASRRMSRYYHSEAKGRFRLSANYQIGRLLHQGGFYPEALKEHERFLSTKPRDRSKWLWFKGWMRLRSGDCTGAMEVFTGLQKKTNTLVGPKALYWYAHCARETGQTAKMDTALRTLQRRSPLSYYGFLGRHLSGSPVIRILKAERPVTTGGLGRFEKRLPASMAKLVRRTRLLAVAGFPKLARSLAKRSRLRKRARRALPRRFRGGFSRALDRTLENWGPVWKRMSTRTKRLAWTEGLAGLSSSLRQRVYPPAYLKLARAAGEDLGVSPWWLLAHMLQESRYKERAKSHAWALGPMQILPRTGRRLAQHIGYPAPPFRDSRLHDPGVALRQAAAYLAMLKDEFGGNTMFAMAAYNGGPRRMSEHLKYVKDLSFVSAIGEIGAHETRNYVRKIVDHTLRYAELYGTDEERTQLLKDLVPPAGLPISKGKVRF